MIRILSLFVMAFTTFAQSTLPIENIDKLSHANKLLLARVLFNNETGCNPQHLMQWNPYENFLSIGILHSVAAHRFFNTSSESFPTFWAFLMEQHQKDPSVQVPEWMTERPVGKNWIPDEWVTVKTRPEKPVAQADGTVSCFPNARVGKLLNFADKFDRLSGKIQDPQVLPDPRIAELKEFLNHPKVVSWQAQFALMRVRQAADGIERTMADSPELPRVRENFAALLKSPQGIFALADYTNWKGEGVGGTLSQRSFGLRMVLRNMKLPPNYQSLSDAEKPLATTRAFGQAVMQTFKTFVERRHNEQTDRSECGLQRDREAYNRWMSWLTKGGETYPCFPDVKVEQRSTCKQAKDGGFLVRINRTYVNPDFDAITRKCSSLGSSPVVGQLPARVGGRN